MSRHNISYTEEGLTDAKKELTRIAQSLETNVLAVIAAANRVSEGWTGTNADLYVTKFNEYKPNMDKLVRYINYTVNAMDKTNQRFQENEQANKTAINNLPY